MNHLRKLLLAYLTGRVGFAQFHAWFVGMYGEAATNLQGADLDVLRDVALSVAEFTNGDMSEAEFRADIQKFVGVAVTLRLVYQEQPQAYQEIPQVTTGAFPASLTERQVAFG